MKKISKNKSYESKWILRQKRNFAEVKTTFAKNHLVNPVILSNKENNAF